MTFVHIVTLHYIADIIDHTSLIFIVLVFRLMVLGEYCPKENSYMVSELREILVT